MLLSKYISSDYHASVAKLNLAMLLSNQRMIIRLPSVLGGYWIAKLSFILLLSENRYYEQMFWIVFHWMLHHNTMNNNDG
jgi:hypothetical protein